MESIKFLESCVEFLGRMLDDAENTHTRLLTKYDRLDAERVAVDHQVAAAADDVEKAKAELEAAKAELLAAQDQEGAALADAVKSEGDS
jgi:septal ring factor EnvC (AmiA/AmiB activator)